MSNTKLDPRSLTPEERAIVEEMVTRLPVSWGVLLSNLEGNSPYWLGYLTQPEWSQSYESAFARILARRAIFGEPASEVPVEEIRRYWRGPIGSADLKKVSDWLDSQPEPASEPAKVGCPNCGKMTSKPHWIDPIGGPRKWYCARPDPASEPAKVRMTEELERLLEFADQTVNMGPSEGWRKSHLEKMKPLIEAVRTQAAEAGKAMP